MRGTLGELQEDRQTFMFHRKHFPKGLEILNFKNSESAINFRLATAVTSNCICFKRHLNIVNQLLHSWQILPSQYTMWVRINPNLTVISSNIFTNIEATATSTNSCDPLQELPMCLQVTELQTVVYLPFYVFYELLRDWNQIQVNFLAKNLNPNSECKYI